METLEPTPSSSPRGKWVRGLAGGLLFVALVAAGVALVPRLLNTGAGAVNLTAAAMPADTQFFFAFNPHFGDLPNGDVVARAWDESGVAQPFEARARQVLEAAGLDWDQDVASWLGDEVAVGVGDLKLGEMIASDKPARPSYVMAAVTRDAARSGALLDKLRAKADSRAQFTTGDYRGVATVAQNGDAKGGPVAYASVKDLVLIASGVDRLHAAIDAALDGTGLDKSVRYQAALAKLRGGRAMTGYVDAGALMTSLLDQLEKSNALPSSVDPAAMQALGAIQGAASGLSFEPNGLRLEFVASTDPDKLPAESRAALAAPASPNRLLRAAPASTFVYLGGSLPQGAFDAMLDNEQFAASIQSLERELGVSLKNDLFSWLHGEIALVAMPGPLGGGGVNPIVSGLALIVDAADPQAADAGADKLVRAFAAQTGHRVEGATVAGAPLRRVQDARGQSTLVYGLLSDHLVMALSESAAQRIATAGDRPLADDDTFKEATAPLPQSNSGYLYVQVKPIVDLASLGLAFSGESCQACDVLRPVRAIAFSSEQPPAEAGVQRSTLFVLLDLPK